MEKLKRRFTVFDDVLGMAMLCTDNFRDVVQDSFGASMITDVLAPIRKQIDSLRVFNEEFQRQALNIDRVLEEARAIQFKDCGPTR
jgi:hypothetical protein